MDRILFMKRRVFLVSVLFIALTGFTMPKEDDVKNYLGTPDSLIFNDISYKLVASYHPSEHYYKQEYVPTGELADHFNTMLTLDFFITDNDAKWMRGMKIAELVERKKNDAVVNYDSRDNPSTGESILDFILSDSNNGKLNVVERNIYKYKSFSDKSGNKGILMLGLSQRGYGDKINDFFAGLKANRMNDFRKLAAYSVPDIEIKK